MKGTGIEKRRKIVSLTLREKEWMMGRAVDFRALRSIIRNIIRNFEWTKELLTDPCRLLIFREKKYEDVLEKSRANLKGSEIRAPY